MDTMSPSLEAYLRHAGAIRRREPEDILKDATSTDAVRRLGEMRLLVLHPDGVLGMTELGRSVLIGLLNCLATGARHLPEAELDHILESSVLAAWTIAFDELPDALRNELEAIAVGQGGTL